MRTGGYIILTLNPFESVNPWLPLRPMGGRASLLVLTTKNDDGTYPDLLRIPVVDDHHAGLGQERVVVREGR